MQRDTVTGKLNISRQKMTRHNPDSIEVAYLGPRGTFSHLVAEKRFGKKNKEIALPTILDVCQHISGNRHRKAIVPIENSSGGAIYETIDILLENKPRVYIDEELTLNVQIALLGRKGEKIKTLYSHFAPLEHCNTWLKANLKGVEHRVVASTAAAALRAAGEMNAAALGGRHLARLYNLNVLRYPVEADLPNVTLFLVLSGTKTEPEKPEKTTLAVRVLNTPGGLCDFLETFKSQNVNLSRLISRPIRGCPRQYAFLVDIEGGISRPQVKQALRLARKKSASLRVVASYPRRKPYRS
ncbi:MAG: prephenate dehydratase [Verrucomicrobiota bacterium]